MSSFETIANIRSLSTSQRSLTPSKIPLRNITPQKVSSNPRNLSSGKSRFGDGNHGVDMADSQPRAPSRSASRRKQRRWENQNIFSAEVNDILLQGLDDEDTHIKIRKPLFKVELRSAFRELFEPKNAGVLEAFRLCAESVDQQHFINSKHQHLSERDKAWFRIERRLRKILIQSVTKNVDILSFVADVEEILIAFLSGRTAFCDGNNREESRVLQSLLVNVPLINNDKNLEIELKDSAFHRLLLHSVCQYHGLASKVSFF